MARNRRYYRPRKSDANYTWQSFPEKVRASITSGANPTYHGVFPRAFTPGIGVNGADDFDAFDSEHTLERVVGGMSHNASGFDVNTIPWICVSLAMIKVPKGLELDTAGINLFDNSEADDFIYRMDAVCNPTNVAQSIPNWHMVNQKTRRKFEVGDTIWVLWSVYNQPEALTRNLVLDFTFNLRFLWRLKS